MCEALDDTEGSVCIGDWLSTSFRLADNIVVIVEEDKAEILVDCLDTTTTIYKIKFSP